MIQKQNKDFLVLLKLILFLIFLKFECLQGKFINGLPLGNPVSDAEVIVRNATDVVVFDRWTDKNEYCKWIVVSEYIGESKFW